ncbi:MAG: DNA-binding protein [Azospirillum sp.]|nr:DNA-binding protein [Azospirillum sp.]
MKFAEQEFLTRKEASTYIGKKGINVSVSQLSKFATYGGGPLFYKFGKKKVVYKISDIENWIKQQLSIPLASSSQLLGINHG